MAGVKEAVLRSKESEKAREEDENRPSKPKELSKAGLWRRAHPNGLDVIYIDWKAVMR